MDPLPKRALMSFITLSTALAWVVCDFFEKEKRRERDEVLRSSLLRWSTREKGGKKKLKRCRQHRLCLSLRHSSPRTRTRAALTFSEEEAEDVAEEAEALEALAATARDAKEATFDVKEGGDDDDRDNAGENERREREAAPPPIRLSAIAVARSMVSFVGLEERETRRCWRWSIVRGRNGGETERERRGIGHHSELFEREKEVDTFFFFFLLLSTELLSVLSFCFWFSFLPRTQCIRSPPGAPRSSRPARRRRALRRAGAAAAAAAAAADERCPDRRCRRRRRNRRSSRSVKGRFRPLRCLHRCILFAIGSTSAATPPARRRTSRGAR